jgi:uncharacterized membrane protein YqiK
MGIDQLISVLIYAGVALGALLIIGIAFARLYRRASKEIGFVRTGFGGEKVVINGGAVVLPVFHETMPVNMNTVRLAVERKNTDALITSDRMRIDVKAEFYVRVVVTARETEVAERAKRIELIEAAKEAERQAIGIKVEAEAEKRAAADRAEALRAAAEGEAEAEKLRADAARVRFEVDAAGQRAINEAANLLSSEQISLQMKLALLKVLPEVIREAAKPMESIDSIKIVQVDGLTGSGASTSQAAQNGHRGDQNLANSAVSAALRYRAQAPIADSLMKELGFGGQSLDELVNSAAGAEKPSLPAAE